VVRTHILEEKDSHLELFKKKGSFDLEKKL